MSRGIHHSMAGDFTAVPAQIVCFRWHECAKPGRYLVHIQNCSGTEQAYDTGVFEAGELMRHAVVDDFGILRLAS